MYLEAGSLNISQCTITNNNARSNGGVLFVLTVSAGYVIIDNNTNISANRAVEGAVIHTTKDINNNEASKNTDVKSLTILISNSNFSKAWMEEFYL